MELELDSSAPPPTAYNTLPGGYEVAIYFYL